MATIAAIAGKRDVAIRRIVAVSEALSQRLNIEIKKFPAMGRDPAYSQMEQLTHIADILEAVQQALEVETADTIVATDTTDNDTMLVREQDGAFVQDLPDYDSMTKAELAKLAFDNGLTLDPRMNKADMISRLTGVESADDGSDTANG